MILIVYILREFFKFVLAGLVICLFLFIFFDFMHKTKYYFGAYTPGVSLVLQQYLFQIPYQALIFLPIICLIASVFVVANMVRFNEITVLKSFGVSLWSLSFPFIC